jgi:hypothetical protein
LVLCHGQLTWSIQYRKVSSNSCGAAALPAVSDTGCQQQQTKRGRQGKAAAA